jgi:hypothetical protein
MVPWSKEEDTRLEAGLAAGFDMAKISAVVFSGERDPQACKERWEKKLNPALVKGPWTKEEDEVVIKCKNEGVTKWSEIAKRIPGESSPLFIHA